MKTKPIQLPRPETQGQEKQRKPTRLFRALKKESLYAVVGGDGGPRATLHC